MPRQDDLSRSLVTLEQDSTLIAVVELSQSSWLVAGIVPGLARHPLKKLEPDQEALLRLLQRWREEASKAGRTVMRIAVAFEAGRDGFWLARWLRTRGVEAHVIHPTSVAVSREHRRAKTDRLDTELLKRAGRRRSRQCLIGANFRAVYRIVLRRTDLAAVGEVARLGDDPGWRRPAPSRPGPRRHGWRRVARHAAPG
jgi:hypothetical protein